MTRDELERKIVAGMKVISRKPSTMGASLEAILRNFFRAVEPLQLSPDDKLFAEMIVRREYRRNKS